MKKVSKPAMLCVTSALLATVSSLFLTVAHTYLYQDQPSYAEIPQQTRSNTTSHIAANPIDPESAENLLPDELEAPVRFAEKDNASRVDLSDLTDEDFDGKILLADIAVEVDYEAYVAFGGNQAAVQNYVNSLISAVSDIYQRELNVKLRISHLRMASSANDPWAAKTTYTALSELREYWNKNEHTRPRSVVLMLSGKKLGGGAAYIESICWYNYNAKESYDYAVVGNMNGKFSVVRSNDNWDLVAVAHELGHAFGSRHSHCTKRANNRNAWYDTCWSGENGCYAGAVSAMDGTLMSYCDKRGGMSKVMLSFADNTGDPAIKNTLSSFSKRMVESNRAEGGCLKVVDAPVPPTPTPTPTPSPTPTPTATPVPPNLNELIQKFYLPMINMRKR
jgi:hypothetical protein